MPLIFRRVLQTIPRFARYGQDIVARVAASRVYTWARPIFASAGADILARGDSFVVEWTAR